MKKTSDKVIGRKSVYTVLVSRILRRPTFIEYRGAVDKAGLKTTDRTIYRDMELFSDKSSPVYVDVAADDTRKGCEEVKQDLAETKKVVDDIMRLSLALVNKSSEYDKYESKIKQLEELVYALGRRIDDVQKEVKSIREGEKIVEKVVVPSKEAFFKENHLILQQKYGKNYNETKSSLEIDKMWKDRIK